MSAHHASLRNPAKREYCIREAAIDGKDPPECQDEINFSQGHHQASTVHVIHLRRNSTKSWERVLLAHDIIPFRRVVSASEQPSAFTLLGPFPGLEGVHAEQTKFSTPETVVTAAQLQPAMPGSNIITMTKVQQIPFHSSVGFYEAAPPQCIVIRQAITAADGPSPASSWAYPTNDLLSTESSSRSANDLNQVSSLLFSILTFAILLMKKKLRWLKIE
ncbi:unnamed protein product [Toxocara canis]|uniref:SUN domain-containing protein n=1 Tax=Toxocara canis TaxID=6265 RepID=A0A183U8V7_TOXCA|nr:unnamed protein product [Toxocara canis]